MEIKEKRVELIKEARSILELAKSENRDLTSEERSKYDDNLAEVGKIDEMVKAEERVARLEESIVTVPITENRGDKMELSEIKSALIEKRAITLSGTGAVSVVNDIVREMTNKQSLLSKFRYFYGPNANTIIPILSPSIAVPAAQSEGASSIASDSTAVLGKRDLQPKAYVSILPVSAETLAMSGSNIEAQLPAIFAEAFGKAMLAGALNGDSTMSGIFDNAALTTDIACAAAGTPKLLDLAKLALTVQDYMDDGFIVINPQLVAAMLAETTAESAPIKAELMATRTVMGVPVVLSGLAPTTLTAGSVVAVAMNGSNYGIAVANALQIKPKEKVGDTNVYFEATLFFNGAPIVAKNGIQLKTV